LMAFLFNKVARGLITSHLWLCRFLVDVMFDFRNLNSSLKNVLKILLVKEYCCMSSKYLMNLTVNYYHWKSY
jgi:hypothetical protein